MTKIRLYIATSLDGYIARLDGSIDWLTELPVPEGVDYGYPAFIETIDTVVLGRKTYEDVLGFDVDWPYSDYNCVVITKRQNYEASTPRTTVINDISTQTVEQIKALGTKDVWVTGGGEIISEFLNLDEIDSMVVTIVPVILGSGRPLFTNKAQEKQLKHISTETFDSGFVNLIYEAVKH
jgi:dihydrofolate reductase